MQSLFPQGNQAATAAPLIQFRAGKCTMSTVQPNGKFMITPDPRSGRVSLSKGADGLVHFRWTNALTNTVEDDRIVFPGEYTFKKVNTGRTDPNDRVYMLRYNSGSQRMMFWLQEKSADQDAEVVKKMNDLLLNPLAAVAATTSATTSAAGGAGEGVVSPDEWMRLIGLDPSDPASAGLAAAAAGGARSSSAPLGPPLAPTGLGNLDISQILRTLSAAAAQPTATATTNTTATTINTAASANTTAGVDAVAGLPTPPPPTTTTTSPATTATTDNNTAADGTGNGSDDSNNNSNNDDDTHMEEQ